MQVFFGQAQVHHAPYGDVVQVGNPASVGIPHHEVDEHRAVLVGQYAYGHTVCSCQEGIAYITPFDARPERIGTHIVRHERLARGSPVVLYRIRVYIFTLAHDVFRLAAQLAEHRRVGTGELYFHRVRGSDREIVFPHPDVCVGIAGTKLIAHRRKDFHHRSIVFAIHHQLSVAIAS